ncbi:MAG: hypothetical protein H7X86_14430, partial [Gorillibacterium sp.]|nr:hypothetical protein [Gorillibacterium sp.]
MKKKGSGAAKAGNPKARGYLYDARTQELHWLEHEQVEAKDKLVNDEQLSSKQADRVEQIQQPMKEQVKVEIAAITVEKEVVTTKAV